MKIRIQKNLFTGEYSDHLFKGSACIGELLDQYQCSPESQVFLNGEMVTDLHTIAGDGAFVVVKEVPKGVTALIVTSIVLGVAGVVLGGVALYKALTANPSLPNIQTSPSLRGSTNSARKGERLPILLGHWRIYPDHASLPYSRYADNNQFFVQQFCFGYSDVSLDMATAKIGDTLISKYTGVQTSLTPSTLYAARVIESQIGVELSNDGTATPIERTTSSGTTKINVGVIAPSGIYKYNGSDKESTVIGVKIEWRIPDGTWNVFADESLTLNVSRWRKMYEITPSGSADGSYDIRVSRTNKAGSTTSYNDTIYFDVLQSYTKNQNDDSTIPVLNPSNLRLLAVDIKATDQLNGTIDSINVEGTLNTRVWDGVDTGSAHWTTAATRNPAAAILYLLTNSKVNPRPVADTQIVWDEFEEFYQYCEDQGFHCDAWITGDYTIGQLIDLIAQSNMAEIRRSADSVGIIIDKINPYIAQMFTPLNAAGFSMKKDFSSPTEVLNLKFVDASIGYEESERNVSIVNDSIVFDRVLTDEDESTEITLFGVTDPAHVAKVGRYRLLEITRRKRTFSWSCDIEGILCTRGDVVLLSNDKFLLGTGEGRVSGVIRNAEGLITAIELDSEIDMVAGNYYGIRIRTIDHILGSYEIVNAESSKRLLQLKTPIDETIVIGDLVAVGVLQRENLKVLITEITQDTNRVCKISGIEYAEEIYTDGTVIPAYQSGLSVIRERALSIKVPTYPPGTNPSINVNAKTALLKPGTIDEREDFAVKITTGQVDEEGAWDIAPEFYIKTGEDYLLAIDNNFIDSADDSIKKRALIMGNGDLAVTNKHIYMRNAIADGMSATRCNLRGNFETEILINPALIAQPSSRAITSLQTLKVQQKSLAYDLCVWAQANGIGFNNLYRCEVSEEPDVGWVMFATNTALGTWGSSEIECFAYFYGDTGDSLYRCSSKCTYEAYTVQNEWIFGWPWFGTHTEYHWVTYGSLSGLIDTDYEEDDGTVSRGIGFSVAPVQAIDPSSITIDIPGYGVDLRNNTDVTVDGVTCDGFSEEGGQSMAFRCYFGSDYDLYMKKLPGNDTATVESLASGALYRGAGGALYVK
nr:phage tail protein [uncultured Sphaerochaeta sp.]